MATTKKFVARFGVDNNGNSIDNLGVTGASLSLAGANSVTLTSTGATNVTLPTSGTLATTDQIPTVNNGTLTLGVSGTGLTGSATFTANQSGNATFTVTSNATALNTPSAIVSRDASGNFAAGTITAALTGNASSATILATGRTISMTGDVAWTSASFNGSGNVTGTSTLATVNSNVGTFGAASSVPTLTVNAKGLVTAASTIAIQIAESQITDGTLLARLADTETITGTWTFNNPVTVGTPTANSHAATKLYVDNAVTGLDFKQSVRVATTANITLSGLQTIDGVSLFAGDRVLVKDQTTGSQNGIYIAGTGAWTLATDADGSPGNEVTPGMFVFVESGTTNADTGWVLATDNPVVVGVTSLTFTQFTSQATVTAGAGLTKTGNTLDVGTASTARIVVNADNIDLATVTDGGTGSFLKFTRDAYGRVSGTTAVTASDINGLVSGTYVAKGGDSMSGPLSINSGLSVASSTSNLSVLNGANYGFIFVPRSIAGGWNTLTQAGDSTIIFQSAATADGASGLVIGPWSASNKGIRIASNGNVGIGRQDAQAPLHVLGSQAIVQGTTSAWTVWKDGTPTKAIQMAINTATTDGLSLRLYNGTTWSEGLYIDTALNIVVPGSNLYVGGAADLLIQHNGTDAYIRPQNTGAVLYLGAVGTNTMAVTTTGAGVTGSFTATTNITASGSVAAGSGSNGITQLNPGTVSASGYLSFFSPAGNRQGYIGSSTTNATSTDTGTIPYVAGTHAFTGAMTVSGGITASLSGNASTATTLQNARTINGVSFNGSANISINLNNSLTFNNAGSGAASGTTFNGSAAQTISYNTIGAPSTTGVGASGSWSINITGSAGTASVATSGYYLRVADGNSWNSPSTAITTSGARGTDLAPNTFANVVATEFKNSSLYGFGGNYTGLLTFAPYNSTSVSTGDPSYQLAFSPSAANATSNPQLRLRAGIDSTWGAWNVLLHSSNFNSYAPTLTGTGASGTWGINISGSAATLGGYAASVSQVASTVVLRDTTGYAYFNYINSNTGNSENPAISQVIVTNGSDNFYRKASISHLTSSLTGMAQIGIGDTTGTGSALRIAHPQGGSFATGTATITGAIKIRLPAAALHSGSMVRFTVKIYEYEGGASGKSRTVEVGGYNYSVGPTWIHYFAYQNTMGGGDINVRFGHDGTGNCVWIGDTSTVWDYPQVFVTDVQVGYSNYSFATWATGWSVSVDAAYGTVTNGPIIAAAPYSSQNIPVNLTINPSTANATYPMVWHAGPQLYDTAARFYVNPSTGYMYSGAFYADNWFRSSGTSGWFNETYGGGIYMTDTSWIRTYNSRGIYSTYYGGDNSGTYGSIDVRGTKNGYGGMYLADCANTTNGMFDTSGNGGNYDPTTGWHFYWNRGHQCLGVGSSTTSSGYKMYISGALYTTGDITAFSDIRVKADIEVIPNALAKVEALRGVTYRRTDQDDPRRQTGVIAQEVEAVLPEAVRENDDGIKGVNYGNMVGLLIEAVKELSEKVKGLEARLAKYEG